MTHISAVRFHAVNGRRVFFAQSAYCILTSASHQTKCHLHSPPVVYTFPPASGNFRSFNPPRSSHSLHCMAFDPPFPRTVHFFSTRLLYCTRQLITHPCYIPHHSSQSLHCTTFDPPFPRTVHFFSTRSLYCTRQLITHPCYIPHHSSQSLHCTTFDPPFPRTVHFFSTRSLYCTRQLSHLSLLHRPPLQPVVTLYDI